MKKIIECVPNFSEGRDKNVIDAIVAEIGKGGFVKVLDVDPGEATNRTVVTFVGEPDAVVEAALRGMKKAAELIDMRQHHGAHPRMGATDVCPLIPVSGISLEECAQLARKLAERAATELNIPAIATRLLHSLPNARILLYAVKGNMKVSLKEWVRRMPVPTMATARLTMTQPEQAARLSVHATSSSPSISISTPHPPAEPTQLHSMSVRKGVPNVKEESLMANR